MIFETDPEQIEALDSLELVQLMKRLMLAECRLVGVPLRGATVPLQITVADGGEDGRAEWTGGVDATDYFPGRLCLLQSKAQNITDASIAKEILKKGKKGKKPKLNDAVSEALVRGGAYIVFCSHPFTGKKIKKLKEAIGAAIRKAKGDPAKAQAIEIYDANRIADWVNTHQSVALWLAAKNRGRSLAGFLSHEGWGRAAEINGVPWIADDKPRFEPANVVIPAEDRRDKTRNTWTFEQATTAVVGGLATDKVAVRVAGPSGFGKSRFVYEMFNRGDAVADMAENAAIIYADYAVTKDEVLKLALEIADSGSAAILVVDECPDDIHLRLVSSAQRAGSKLRVVTIDVETKIVQAKETLAIRLEPAAGETIGAIAGGIAPALQDGDAQFIRELSDGFPQMAVLAAQQDGDGRLTIQSVDQILDRIIWGKKTRNDEAQRVLETASLFEWIGLTERVGDDAAVLAAEFVGVSKDRFVEHLLSFKGRGIITRRGDYLQVGPIPLAARLGAQRLSVLPEGKLAAFFAKASPTLKKAMLRRLRWLDTVPAAKDFAKAMLQPDNLGNLAVLNTDFGAECLYHLIHIDPDLAMATVDRVFGKLTIDELKQVEGGRRYLVWALERLVFRKQSFERAATLLRRLAVAETEDRISNNATGQFTQLFQLYLSGTEAAPDARLAVLDDGLKSSDPKEREVCLKALDHMLDAHHFSRGGGAEEIGSGDRLKDWQPKIYGDIQDFFRAALNRLLDIALANDPLAADAKKIIGSHIRGLFRQLPFDEVKGAVARIVGRYGFWPEAVQEVNEWLYFDRKDAPKEMSDKIRAYFDEMLPVDPIDLVVLYTQGWMADFHDPDVDYDRDQSSDHEYAIRKAVDLAATILSEPALLDRAVDRLVLGSGNSVFAFARRLAELASDPVALFESALAKADSGQGTPNRQFFSGLIAGTDARNPDQARACIRAALKSEKLKKDAISLIGAGKLQPADLQLVIALLANGDIQPWQAATLSHGRGMEHLAPDEIVPLLTELERQGARGLWSIFDILSLVLYGGKKPAKPIENKLKSVLLSNELFDELQRDVMDGHHLKEMIGLLARHRMIDTRFAKALAAQLFSICERRRHGVYHALDDPVREALKTLIPLHPKEVWNEAARRLTSDDAIERHYMSELAGEGHNDHLLPGVLFDIPAALYLDWARKDPKSRAALVVEWLPVATKGQDGSLAWTPEIENFVAEFAGEENVLNELAVRLHPRSWWGSLAQHIEPTIPLLESWLNDKRPEVRAWAQRMIDRTKAKIAEENLRSEEFNVRL